LLSFNVQPLPLLIWYQIVGSMLEPSNVSEIVVERGVVVVVVVFVVVVAGVVGAGVGFGGAAGCVRVVFV
jgi:hypothetical protein